MATPAPRSPLTLRRFDEILAMQFDDSDNILGDRQIAKGQNCCIVGPSGAGKTRLVMQMAIAGIAGMDFLGLPVNGRSLKWLFLQVENSNRRLQIDLGYFKAWVGEAWPAVQAQCMVHTLENDSDGMVFLENNENQQAVHAAILTAAADVVVWDSLQNFAIGDLNKDADMFRSLYAISTLTKRGNPQRVPFPIHHALTGRSGAIKALGMDRTSYGRNSKTMHAWTRSQINVAVASPNSYETIIISCGKCSDGKEFEPFAAKFDEDTHIYHRDDNFDLDDWVKQVKANKPQPKVPDDVVVTACNGYRMSKHDLLIAIRRTGVTADDSTIYRAIDRVVKRKGIKFSKKDAVYEAANAKV
jgi:energy-coupling factor transporter ATP-binding protein EcfA2